MEPTDEQIRLYKQLQDVIKPYNKHVDQIMAIAVWFTHYDTKQVVEKPPLTRVITRHCPNCGHENTKEESCNKYTCRYCENESDTNF